MKLTVKVIEAQYNHHSDIMNTMYNSGHDKIEFKGSSMPIHATHTLKHRAFSSN